MTSTMVTSTAKTTSTMMKKTMEMKKITETKITTETKISITMKSTALKVKMIYRTPPTSRDSSKMIAQWLALCQIETSSTRKIIKTTPTTICWIGERWNQ